MGILGTLGSLNVLLSADTSKFSSAMEKAAYTAERNLQRISLQGKITMAAINTAIIASGTAIALSVKKAIDHADQISEMSQAIGLTAEQLSSLEYAAKMSGLGLDDLRTSFQKFDKAIFQAASGSKEVEAAFKSLGIAVTDSNGNIKNNYNLFLESADALSKMSDGAQKTALTMALFGKNGAVLLPLLNEGKVGIQKFTEEAVNLGVVVSGETAAAADKFNDNMQRIASGSQGLINSFTSGLIPSLATMTENIAGSSAALETFRAAGLTVADIIIIIANSSMGAARSISTVIETLSMLYEQTNLLMTGQFKKANEVGGKFWAEQDKKWTDLAVTVQKNWEAMSGGVQSEASNATKKIKDVSDATETFNKKMEEGKTLTELLRTAQEKYDDEMERYNDLLAAGAINQETFERAAAKAKDTLEKSTHTTNKLQDAAKDLGFTFQSAFEDAILEGKRLREIMTSLLKDIERIIIRKAITEPIAAAIGSFFSTSGSTQQTTTKSAHGNVFSRLTAYASGGLITSPMIFPMANGGVGLAGEAGTEAIMPLFRGSNGDLGVKARSEAVEINIYAPEGSRVSQSRQTIGDKEQINIMIDEAVAGSVKDPGSKTYRALKNSFGLRQSLTTR